MFEKALQEPAFSPTYAEFCCQLSAKLPAIEEVPFQSSFVRSLVALSPMPLCDSPLLVLSPLSADVLLRRATPHPSHSPLLFPVFRVLIQGLLVCFRRVRARASRSTRSSGSS